MLAEFLAGAAFAHFLVFARLGSAFALLPGFGEAYVAMRWRLMLALAVSVAVTPAVQDGLPGRPDSPLVLVMLLASEIAIGLFLGFAARLVLLAFQTVGVIFGFQSGLSGAAAFDPVAAGQTSIAAVWLSIVALTAIFAADLHHLALEALVDSYFTFPAGAPPPVDDLAAVATRLVAESFTLGLRIAAPFLAFGVVFFLALGLLARLMPQVQVFFVVAPLQIALGFAVLAGTLAAGMGVFLDAYARALGGLLAGG